MYAGGEQYSSLHLDTVKYQESGKEREADRQRDRDKEAGERLKRIKIKTNKEVLRKTN